MELRWSSIVVSTLISFLSLTVAAEKKVSFEKIKLEISYKTKKKVVSVDLAKTQEQHSYGLMNREKLGAEEGMLFVFPEEAPREFWMKNTLVDLDIGFFDREKKLVDIQQMKAVTSVLQTDLPTYPSKRPAQYALEMSKGWFKKNKLPVGSVLKILSRP